MAKVVTFGEIMLRLTPPAFQRFTQAQTFEVVYGGAEANVAVSLAHFGESAEFITRLPPNDLAEACLAFLRGHGVGVGHVLRGGRRLGIYFLEQGIAQRGGKVIYDRAGSSFAGLQPGMVDWDAAFAGADWFHWTGITPALTAGTAEVCGEAIRAARARDLTVSCDLNYRHQLWQWGRPPVAVMPDLVAHCQVLVGNVATVATMLDLPAPAAADPNEVPRLVAERLAARFPSLTSIAFTQRDTHSASHHHWTAVLWQSGTFYTGLAYDLTPIVDRLGGGDAFTAGLIYGLRHHPADPAYALNFAIAAACLKHSIHGDSNIVTVAEVEQLMAGGAAGEIRR